MHDSLEKINNPHNVDNDEVEIKVPEEVNAWDTYIDNIKKKLQAKLKECQGSLLWELSGGIAEFNEPVEFLELKSLPVQTGLNDVLLVEISQLGHRDKFPRQYDWENLLPTLEPQEELLWIAQKTESSYNLYLGLKFNQDEIKSIETINHRKERFKVLCSNFSRRAFPESVLKKELAGSSAEKLKNIIDEHKNVFCVTGMPSYKTPSDDEILAERDDETRPYSSINDVLESHHDIDKNFTIIFSVAQTPHENIKKDFENKFMIRNGIKPLIEQTFNDTMGESLGGNISESKTKSEITIQHTITTPQKDNIFMTTARGIKNFFRGGKGQVTESIAQTMPGDSNTSQYGSHHDKNISVSMQYTVSNTQLEFLDKRLENSIRHLQQTPGTGGYYASAIVYSSTTEFGMSLSRSLRAVLSGTHSNLRPIQIFKITGATDFQLRNIPLYVVLQAHRFYPEILNCEKACLSLLLPDSDLPGLKLKKNVFYGRPESIKNNDERVVQLGNISYFSDPSKEAIQENNLLQNTNDYLAITPEDLCSHMFIVGTTGSGKTKRAAWVLNSIPSNVRIIVLETAKKTYRDMMNRRNRPPLVYTLGNSQMRPFRINPFFFEQETSLKQHISVLADAIADLLPMEALIGPKLREAIESCYYNCGWDIETNKFMFIHRKPIYPDMIMFNKEVHRICETLSDYGDEVRANYRGALLNRAGIFIDNLYQDIFAYNGNKTIDEMFPHDEDAIIEMEDMPPSEINMPAFIISILLHRIRARQSLELLKNQQYSNIEDNKFLLVIEEAHNVIDRKYEEKSDEKQSGKGGHLVKQVVRLLAEGRGLGIGIMVIDQSANKIAPSVIANTNTKMIFRQEDGEEIKTVGTAIGLKEQDWNDLQMLEQGECIVKSKTSSKPVKLEKLSKDAIEKTNKYSSKTLFGKETVCAPYSRGLKAITALFDKVFFRPNELDDFIDQIFKLCNDDLEVLKYIIGKYFLSVKQYGLLELLPDVSSKSDFKKILILSPPTNQTRIAVLTLLRALYTRCKLPNNFAHDLDSNELYREIKSFNDCFMSYCFSGVKEDLNYRSRCIQLCNFLNAFTERFIQGNINVLDFDSQNVFYTFLKTYQPLMDAFKLQLLFLETESLIYRNKLRKEDIKC